MHVSRNNHHQPKSVRESGNEAPKQPTESQHNHHSPSHLVEDDGGALPHHVSPQNRIVLTFSPRADNKLALRYEDIGRVRLCPDNLPRLMTPAMTPTIIAAKNNNNNNNNCVTPPVPDQSQRSELVPRLVQDEFEAVQRNIEYLTSQKAYIASQKLLLEEKVQEEQTRNDFLKTFNENLRISLSSVNIRALELSIDRQALQDEIQNVLWQWNSKFLLPLKNGALNQNL